MAGTTLQPLLPAPRGPVSAAVCEAVVSAKATASLPDAPVADADPFGDDLQSALLVLYELHYRGFAEVSDDREWDPDLLTIRGRIEHRFLEALRDRIGQVPALDDQIDRLLADDPDDTGVSGYLRDHGSWSQMQDYFVHRSIYQLKESDPYIWLVPRLRAWAKAGVVAVSFDEFGGGRGDHVHAELFRELLRAADLRPDYLAYVDQVPAEALAAANLPSVFALHRRWRGAAVGHFVGTEVSTGPGAKRLVDALDRLGAPAECRLFYSEHVLADAVHEQVLRHDVVAQLVEHDPTLADDIAFGIAALSTVEDDLSTRLFASWGGAAGQSPGDGAGDPG